MFRQPLGKYERGSLNLDAGGRGVLSLIHVAKQVCVGTSSEGCTSHITSMYLIWPLLFVKHYNKEAQR